MPKGSNINIKQSFTGNVNPTRWKDSTKQKPVSIGKTKSIKSSSRSNSKAVYPEEEPERYYNPNHVSYKLLEKVKDKIFDFKSFEEILSSEWSKDLSLKSLVESMQPVDFEALYNTDTMQRWVKENQREIGIDALMKLNKKIDCDTANAQWDRLSRDKQIEIISSVKAGGINFSRRLKKIPKVKFTANIPFIKQKASSGKIYKRAKPQKWSALQENYIRNKILVQPDVTAKNIIDEYNKIFLKALRTKDSLRNKIYRTKRVMRDNGSIKGSNRR